MPADETHSPDPTPRGIQPSRGGDLAVLQYQVGQMQTTIDRGLGSLERALDKGHDAVVEQMEKGFAQITARQDRHEEELRTIKERQAFDAARLKALEQFREEQDRRELERTNRQQDDLARAVDSSQHDQMLRLLGKLFLGALTALSTILAILFALNGGFN